MGVREKSEKRKKLVHPLLLFSLFTAKKYRKNSKGAVTL